MHGLAWEEGSPAKGKAGSQMSLLFAPAMLDPPFLCLVSFLGVLVRNVLPAPQVSFRTKWGTPRLLKKVGKISRISVPGESGRH